MIETAVNVKEILKKYGLQVKEIEPEVYEVLNTNQEVSIDELQWELNACILITSNELRSKRLESGINTMIADVYYIVLDYDNDDLGYQYYYIAKEKFNHVLYMPYKYDPAPHYSIDTIYAEGEI